MYLQRLLALFLLASGSALAQRYADLCGRVLDASEGGISEASITVTNEETGFRRVTQSQTGGTYSVSSLQAGTYKVTVRKEGFRTVVRFGVQLAVSALTRADFILPVGSIEESITVYGNAPQLERQDVSTGGRIERDEIERVPLNGRGLLTLLELIPGTNVTPATRGEAGQFSATGQRPNTNSFAVDGVSANTGVTAGGLPAQSAGGALPALSAFGSLDSLISIDAVQEFRVATSTSAAEFGRLPGAIVALSSRSGTNEFHGTTAYRIRNELLSANNWFANQAGYGPLPLRLQNFAQTIGGPLRRNRTFFFVSYERMSLRQPYVWRQPVPSSEARESAAEWAQPLLNLFPMPGAALFPGSASEWLGRSVRPAGVDVGGVRIDQAIGSRVSIFGRYNDSPSDNEFGTLAINRLSLRSRSLTLGANARPHGNLIFDVRANESQVDAHSRWSQGIEPGCELEPLVSDFLGGPTPCDYLVRFSIGGIGQLISGREGDRRQRQFQLIETGSWRRGGNTLMLGGDYRRIVAVRRDPFGTLGVIADSFTSLTQDRRKLWVARTDARNELTRVKELSLWIQDTWQPVSRLTLSGGLRWEFSPAPAVTDPVYFFDAATNSVFRDRKPLWRTSYRNFAPRFGAALRLSKTGATVVRAGGGLYFDSSLSVATDILNGGPLSLSTYSSAVNGLFSTQLTFGFLPDLRLPRVKQWNVSLEHAFSSHDIASIGYVGAAARRLLRREVGGEAFSTTSWVALTTNRGYSDYHALELQYRRKVARGFQAVVAYAWSHSIDNDSSDAFLTWTGSGTSDKGSSDFDLRHSLTGTATYEFARARPGARASRLLGGWAFDTVFHARTSFPVTVLNAEQYQGVTLVNAFRPDLNWGVPLWVPDPSAPGGRRLNRAAFHTAPPPKQGSLGRNVLGGFGMSQVDLAMRREFRMRERARLELRLEAFNLLNHANFGDPVSYLNSPVFGRSNSMLNLMLGSGSPGSGLSPILQTGGPRSMQGSLRFRF